MLPEITNEEFSAALDDVSREVLAEAGIVKPPIDATRLAAALGLSVAVENNLPERGRFVRLKSYSGRGTLGSIFLKPDPRRERVQWAIAHEIGEAVAHRVFKMLGSRPKECPPGARETIANLLAVRLLLPRDAFLRSARRHGWDLLKLKRRFETASHELIARRMLDFDPPIVITVFDNGRCTLRRSNWGSRAPQLSPDEAACREAASSTGVPARRETPSTRICAWPIHEPQWKREIMRTACTAVDDF